MSKLQPIKLFNSVCAFFGHATTILSARYFAAARWMVWRQSEAARHGRCVNGAGVDGAAMVTVSAAIGGVVRCYSGRWPIIVSVSIMVLAMLAAGRGLRSPAVHARRHRDRYPISHAPRHR